MVKIKMTVTLDGVAQPEREFDLEGHEARHLGQHLISHALAKIMDMAPDGDVTPAGSRVVQFDYAYDNNGITADSSFKWTGLDDAMVGAIQGAFDGAMAKLDHHIAAKERGHHGKP